MENTIEIWSPIIGYESNYEVSTLGRVKRLAYNRKCYSNKIAKMKERILSGSLQPHGYYTVCLHLENRKENRYVHRIVAEHFISNPDNKKTVNHINGIKTDNRIENLEWATYQENNAHAFSTGLNTTIGSRLIGKKAELCHNYRKSNKRVFAKGLEYKCVADASKSLNLSEGYLYQCLCGSVPNKPEIKYI